MSRHAEKFERAVAEALGNPSLQEALLSTTSRKMSQRTEALAELRNADELCDLATQIKRHTLDHLDRYLEQFIEQVEARGGQVHFAHTPEEACELICRIARENECKLAVKSKSMATEEIELNAALQRIGVEVVETDLGEFIVQIDHDRPSHIVTPIIHKNRREIAEAMARELGVKYTEDPEELTGIARRHLRDIFRRCDLGITGVNFGVAETGTICICTNEGNGRLTLTRPRVHVALMGMEKLIPRLADLALFLKILARSSTGQPITVYTTLVTGVAKQPYAGTPEQLHIVILDGGRSDILGGAYHDILRCIRCGACLNACPVYRHIGGHAYNSVYSGPIGKVLTPLLNEHVVHADLPQASSLCGLCLEVCPVRIDIPELLVRLRCEQTRGRMTGFWHRTAFRMATVMLKSPGLYRMGQWMARIALSSGSRDGWVEHAPQPLQSMTDTRDLLAPARRSFRRIWEEGLRDE
ncbi:MAG: iron-sulfur cluster-binding protein [Phycisphaerales bacterium]|nr:MAG: iron-sulfur cluster-binding protein [Phycisphaerales bacterium]